MPRDREGHFHTQVFDRYSRYEPHIAEGLTQMFVAGTSTQKVGEVAQTLMGVAPSGSTIIRLNQTLTQQFEAWRERPLQAHWRRPARFPSATGDCQTCPAEPGRPLTPSLFPG